MMLGDRIAGTYQIEGVLGEGGMGLILAARDCRDGRRVAIKLLREEVADDISKRRFLREARGAGQLRNPHVAPIIDWGVLADDRPYLVMDMLDGPDLESVLERGPLPAALAVDYIRQACVGLAEAHALGMVHRDIKPANLMLSSCGSASLVKVVDFGIATPARDDFDDSITATDIIVGSLSYMSPEQMGGLQIDARSDIWSLGVTLYELVSGRLPFTGESFAAVSMAILREPHTPLVAVDPRLAAIVDRCLAKDPRARFASVLELSRALADLSKPVAVPTVRRPRRIWTRALLAAFVGMVAFTGVTVAHNVNEPRSAVPASRPTVTPIAVAPVQHEVEHEIEMPPDPIRKTPKKRALQRVGHRDRR